VYYKLGGEDTFDDTTVTVIGSQKDFNQTRSAQRLTLPVKQEVGFSKNYSHFKRASPATVFSGTVTLDFQPSLVTVRGFEYYISGEDGTNTVTTQTASTGVKTQNATDDESIPKMQWRLISVPMEQTDKSFEKLFTSLGAYDPAQWKAYAYENSNYVEIMQSEIKNIETGKSYWLKIRDKDFKLATGEALSVPTEKPYELTLKPGWNLISNPFVFDISWNALRDLLDSMGVSNFVTGPYTYDGSSWRVPWPIGNIVSIETWNGYAVKNETLKDIVLAIPSSAYKPTRAAKELALPAENFWTIPIQAVNGEQTVANRVIGIHPNANNKRDRYDYLKPPPIEQKFSFYMGREWNGKTAKYITDIRAPFEEGQTWNTIVKDASGSVELSFDLASPGLEGNEIYLFDIYMCKAKNLRKNNVYGFKANSASAREFAIIVGTSGYVHKVISQLNIPKFFDLGFNYPNPFKNITHIKYQVPVEGKISLKVFNLQGRILVHLVNRVQKPGFYHVTWNGRDREGNGRQMASGMYIYQLVVKNKNSNKKLFSKAKKMKLVK
jgi:hypothetical protein